MTTITCGECGICYSVPNEKYAELKKTGDTFYCPNGHARHFVLKPTEEEKLIERLRSQLSESWAKYGDIHSELRETKERGCHCILCGYKVARVNAAQVTVDSRMREHLEIEHGARRVLRSLPERASAGNA